MISTRLTCVDGDTVYLDGERRHALSFTGRIGSVPENGHVHVQKHAEVVAGPEPEAKSSSSALTSHFANRNLYCFLSRFPTPSSQYWNRCVIGWPKTPKRLEVICQNDTGRRQTCLPFCPSLVQIFRFTASNVSCTPNERAEAFSVLPCINLLRITDDVSL